MTFNSPNGLLFGEKPVFHVLQWIVSGIDQNRDAMVIAINYFNDGIISFFYIYAFVQSK